MARSKKGDSYELVLESRHLLGIFFGVVLLLGLFFTLGFLLGRNQAAGSAASAPPEKKPAAAPEQPGAGDLTFYESVEEKPATPPETRATPPAATPAPAQPAAGGEEIHLQVAAFREEAEAKALAQKLQELGFPTVIRPPREDQFYRVQVGPFESSELADAAQGRLEAHGYRNLLRR